MTLEHGVIPARFCTECGRPDDGHRHASRSGLRHPKVLVAVACALLGVIVVTTSTVVIHAFSNDRARLRSMSAALTAQAAATRRLDGDLQRVNAKLAALGSSVQAVAAGQSGEVNTAAVAHDVLPSVFTVQTDDAIGSAFAFGNDRGATWLVTNYHVVRSVYERGVRTVTVHRGDETYDAVIDDVDPGRDLARLRTAQSFPVLQRENSAPVVGSPVVAFGAPLGLGGTVTSGVVSAVRDDGLQFSAPISPGNSGGPLVDRTGRVIGVTEAKAVGNGAEGIGFAIPISVVCDSVLSC